MSEYYNSQKVRGLYDLKSSETFKLSRSKIDLFIQCERCFYYDRKLGIGRPPGFPFSLNSAVDHLLKNEEINELDKEWQDGYKRQMEIYQWLFRKNGYKVSDTGYFVYCNGKKDRKAFDGKLDFDVTLIAYKGDDSWVEKTIVEAHKCLNGNKIPAADPSCDYCNYIQAINSK